jgi:flagellar basal-body rod protein FlgB
MIQEITNNQHLQMMKKTADQLSFRHTLLTNNIANVNTPRYKRRDTADFQKMLREAVDKKGFQSKTSDSRHIKFGRKDFDEVKPTMIIQDFSRFRTDKSSVDIDTEMAEFSKNSMRYQLMMKRMGDYFKRYKEILQSE